jgi:prepilin-type N-terminal cleavage/methylation domain-containing protein
MAIKSRQAAFTLIELLAVIVILAILSYFLVTNLTSATKTSEAQRTHVVMETIQIALAEYSDDKGDLPHSNFTSEQGTPPNLTNLGSECLYLAICAEKAPGDGKFDKDLGNTDEDQTPKRFQGFETQTLFELCDVWGNPIAYFHHRDYDRTDVYVTLDGKTGERLDNNVHAYKNTKTNRYYEPNGCQMISAGIDGKFGTEDDITSFERN